MGRVAVVLMLWGLFWGSARGQPAEKEHVVGKDGLVLEGRIGGDEPKVEVTVAPGKTLRLPSKSFLVRLAGGKSYRLIVASKEIDSFLVVRDAAGKQIDFDDDSGGGLDAALTLDVKNESVVHVFAAALEKTGGFRLIVRERLATDPPALSAEDRAALAEAEALSRQAVDLYRRRNAKAAIGPAEKALAIRKKVLGEQHVDTASSLNILGVLLEEQGDYASARPYYEQALAVRKKVLGEQHPDTATSLNNLGLLLYAQGNYASARPYYEQALAIYKKVLGEQHPDTATLLDNLGLLLAAQGDYASGRPYSEQALAIRKRVLGEQHPATATSLNNLGLSLQAQGDYASARLYYEQALAIRKKILGEHSDTATSLNNLGVLLRTQGDYASARPYYEQALAISKKVLGEQHPYTAHSLNNLGALLHAEGDYASARPYYEQALAIRKKILGEQHPATAMSLSNLGVLLQAQGDYASTRPYFEQALAIKKKVLGEPHPDTAHSLNSLGALLQAQGDDASARPYYEQALAIQRRSLDIAAVALAERQQLAMSEKVRFYIDFLLTLTDGDLAWVRADYEAVLGWKGAVSARQIQNRRLGQDPALVPLAGQMQDLAARLSSLSSAVPDPKNAEAHRKALVRLTLEMEELEVELARRSDGFRQGQAQAKLTPADLAKSLPPGAALVDFLEYSHNRPNPSKKGRLIFERRVAAFVVRKDVPIVRVELPSADEIAQTVEAWRAQVVGKGPTTDDAKDPGQRLRRLVWQPLEEHLAGAKLVLLSPDVALARIPFAALPGKAPGTYLLEEVALSIVPYPRLLPAMLTAPANEAAESLLAVGAVDYGAAAGKAEDGVGKAAARSADRGFAFKPLENTRGEILSIRDSYERRFENGKVSLLREGGATESALRRQAPQHRWLHVATHGFFAPPEIKSAAAPAKPKEGPDLFGKTGPVGFHPGLLSGLALAGANRVPVPGEDDGVLTATEVEQIDLRATELVVLSACETGLGKVAGGEGVLGLQRAFQVSGAGAVVASLWHVDDAVTRQLMEKFYDNLWQHKMPKGEALRQAQLYVLREGPSRGIVQLKNAEKLPHEQRRSPPYYWAAFVLSGDWR
jgi:CHAT domain-containing protein/tetratricopeptide (TPR) repeat protein